uniref:RNA-dependent RNA polymerase n=1 Tax=Reticulitermes flavipes permutotetra-like virus 1 TaxID=3133507 RepID=A0AAT9JA57_9VIRU
MDVSNPVMDETREKVGSMLRRRGLRRQDLASIEYAVGLMTRYTLTDVVFTPLQDAVETAKAIKEAWQKHFQELAPPSQSLSEFMRGQGFMVLPPVDVSRMCREDGTPLHPETVNRRQGKVSVQRQFGGFHFPMEEVVAAIRSGFGDFVPEIASKLVYGAGTSEGFRTRIVKQMRRATKPSMFALGYGSAIGLPGMMKRMAELYGFRDELLPNIFDSSLEELIGDLEISSQASAGLPYCKSNYDALDDVIQYGLRYVVRGLNLESEEDFRRWLTQDPELHMVEVKNKSDRYEVGKLREKTRPYVCVPAHWKLLFSILCQNFQKSLSTFDKVEGVTNAYGFSSAHGGLTRMLEWMLSTKPGQAKHCEYGDDTCLVFRDKANNVLWRVDPDFEQMDGSVDQETITFVTRWVYGAFRQKYGPSTFWSRVASVWAIFARAPLFIADGPDVYGKPHGQGGLMTGVVGTTLFDTVKATCVWEYVLHQASVTGKTLLDVKWVHETTKKLGMVIKPGTYKPQAIIEAHLDQAGALVTRNKFLGQRMQVQYLHGNKVIVPQLEKEEWLELMLTPRETETHSRGKERKSLLQKQRRRFDQMRGYLVTGAIFDEVAREFCESQIDLLPSLPLVMRVQEGGGRGAVLLENSAALKDVQYETSTGVPTVEWALNLYAKEEDKLVTPESMWKELFEGEQLEQLKGLHDPLTKLQPVHVQNPTSLTSFIMEDENDYKESEQILSDLPPTQKGKGNREVKPIKIPVPAPRKSRMAQVCGEEKPVKELKLKEALDKELQLSQAEIVDGCEVRDIPSISAIAAKHSLSRTTIKMEAIKRGLTVEGDLVTPRAVVAPECLDQPQVLSVVGSALSRGIVSDYTPGMQAIAASSRAANVAIVPTKIEPEWLPEVEGLFQEGSPTDRFTKYLKNRWRAQFHTESNEAVTVGEGSEKKSFSRVVVRMELTPVEQDVDSAKQSYLRDIGPPRVAAKCVAQKAKDARAAIILFCVNKWTGKKHINDRVVDVKKVEAVKTAPEEERLQQALLKRPVLRDPRTEPISADTQQVRVVVPKEVSGWFAEMELEAELQDLIAKIKSRSARTDPGKVFEKSEKVLENVASEDAPKVHVSERVKKALPVTLEPYIVHKPTRKKAEPSENVRKFSLLLGEMRDHLRLLWGKDGEPWKAANFQEKKHFNDEARRLARERLREEVLPPMQKQDWNEAVSQGPSGKRAHSPPPVKEMDEKFDLSEDFEVNQEGILLNLCGVPMMPAEGIYNIRRSFKLASIPDPEDEDGALMDIFLPQNAQGLRLAKRALHKLVPWPEDSEYQYPQYLPNLVHGLKQYVEIGENFYKIQKDKSAVPHPKKQRQQRKPERRSRKDLPKK